MASSSTQAARAALPSAAPMVCEAVGDTAPPPPALPRRATRRSNSVDHGGDVETQAIRQRINEWNRKTNYRDMPEEQIESLVIDMAEFLRIKAASKCEDKERAGKVMTCSCLCHLRNESNRLAVARYCINFMLRTRDEQNQTLIDWYRYAVAANKNKQWYLMPFAVSDDEEDSGEVAEALRDVKICRSAIMTLVQIRKTRMKSIKKTARTTGVAKKHGNCGKRKRYAENDPIKIALREHFDTIIKLGDDAPSAARITEKYVDGVMQRSIRDDDEKAVYLPFSMGIRPCYYRYLQEQGYSVKVNQDGTYETKAIPNVEQKPKVCLTTYYKLWQTDYSYLKVNRPVEDICTMCYQFAHRAKYLGCLGVSNTTINSHNATSPELDDSDVNLNVNSSIDDMLFRDNPEPPSQNELEETADEVYTADGEVSAVTMENDNDSGNINADNQEPDMRLVHMLGSPRRDSRPIINIQDEEHDIAPTGRETVSISDNHINVHDPDAPPDERDTTLRIVVRDGSGIEEEEDDDDDDDVFVINPDDERREQMIMRAVMHVKRSRAQRAKYQAWVKEAKDHSKRNVPHKDRTYCGVVDYGQNMELPLYNQQQPGTSYYYSPLSVYNLGFVDHAYKYEDGTIKEHMLAHLYHEGVAKKGANNVCSLVMKSMRELGWLKVDENGKPITGGHLVLNFDNCTGQNKNNVMMKLIPFLYETKFFSEITFNFLVVGHTKNAADRLFNTLKKGYHKKNIYTMDQLASILDESHRVTVLRAEEQDFFDYGTFLDHFYSTLQSKIKQNHIFYCGEGSKVGNQVYMDLRESGLDEDKVVKHKTIKRGFYTRNNYPKTPAGLQLAVTNRGDDILKLRDELLVNLKSPGINVFKKVELYTKYLCGGIVPLEYRDDVIYQRPTAEELKAVKEERKDRKIFREEINEKKAKMSSARKELTEELMKL